LKAPQLLYAK